MLYTFLLTLLVIDCIVLMLAILLQSGKGTGLAASFGGASSSPDALIGIRQAGNLLTKGQLVGRRNFPRTLLRSANHVDAHVGAALGPREGSGHSAPERGASSDISSRGSARAGAGDDRSRGNEDGETSSYHSEAVS